MSRIERPVVRGLGASTLVLCASVGTVAAQTPSDTSERARSVLEEVVVTAERRETRLQETPLAVSAMSGDDLSNRNVNTLQDVSFAVPGLQFGISTGQAHPSIRGIGASDIIFGADPRIAFYLDDVYIGRPEAQLGAFFDVDQVQVLNGPQGTLYGRNATGGALLVNSRRPTDTLDGYVNLTVGNYQTIASEAAISGPLSESFSARVAVRTLDRDGYGKNLTTGADIDDASQKSARVSLLWRAGANFDFLLQGDYHREDDRNYAQHYGGFGNIGTPPIAPVGPVVGGTLPEIDTRNTTNRFDPFNDRKIWGVNGTATWRLGDVTLKSITAYRDLDATLLSIVDPSSLTLIPVYVIQTAQQKSEELQLIADFGRNHLTAGLLYFNEELEGQEPAGLNLLIFGGPDFLVQGVNQAGSVETRSAAAYVRYGYDFTDRLTLTVGGRYTDEKKEIFNQFGFDLATPFDPSNPITNQPPFPYNDETTDSAFTPSGTLSYKFSDDVYGYVTATEGFKSGGFNIGVFQPAFEPEKIWDYELGLKSTLLDGRLQLNTAAFYYDYSNLQVAIVEGVQVIIQNAAKAKLYGGELQLIAAPTKALRLDLAVSALHSEYQDFATADPANPQNGIQDLEGNQLTQAPNLTASVGAEYAWNTGAGTLSLRGEYRWIDDIFFTPFETKNAWSPSHSMGNVFLSFASASGRWNTTAFVRNVSDETVVADAYPTSLLIGTPINTNLEPPRTYGVKLGYNFR